MFIDPSNKYDNIGFLSKDEANNIIANKRFSKVGFILINNSFPENIVNPPNIDSNIAENNGIFATFPVKI
jgi:hypothetical protein